MLTITYSHTSAQTQTHGVVQLWQANEADWNDKCRHLRPHRWLRSSSTKRACPKTKTHPVVSVMRADGQCYKCANIAEKLRQSLWSRTSPQPPLGLGTRSGLYGKFATEMDSGNKLDFPRSTRVSIFLIFASTASHNFPCLECIPPLKTHQHNTDTHVAYIHAYRYITKTHIIIKYIQTIFNCYSHMNHMNVTCHLSQANTPCFNPCQ